MTQSLRHALKSKRLLAISAAAVPLLFVFVALAFFGRDQIVQWVSDGRAWVVWFLGVIPWPLYLAAFCVLPVVGFPLSAFYLTASTVLGGPYGIYGILGAWVSILVNMVLGYWLATGFIHPVVERFVLRRGYSIPKADPRHAWKLVLLIRLSPLPFAVQNLVLGLAHVPFRTYLPLSFLCQAPIGLAVVLVGDSLFTGGFKYAMLGLFAFVLLMFVLHLVRARLQNSNPDVSHPAS